MRRNRIFVPWLQFKTAGFVSMMVQMVKVTEIRRTCFACPAQWEGQAESGYVYIRFRWGTLAVRFGSTTDDAITGPTIFEWHDPDAYGGFMEYDELKKITAGILDLPEAESADEADGIPVTS
jgi:hypothetical protein